MSPTELRTTRASTSKCRVIRPLPPLPSSSPLYRSPLTPSRSPRPLPTPPSSSPIRTLQPSTKNTSLPSILETVALDVRSLPGSETLAPVLVPPCSPEEVLVQPPLLPTTDQNDLDSFPFLPNPHSDCRITLCELLSDDSAREPPPFLQNPHMDYGRLTDENDFWEPPLILTTPSGKKSHPLDGFDTTAYLSAAMTVKKIVDLSPPEDNCDEKEGDEKSLKGRLSRHWVREKRGERREDQASFQL
ncbi:hypothetical protein H0H92_012458 [Tricholoma furcatifolium]|nr:hypothetical protein H0H92_012458 [Tricholoma furcatifolium]